MGDDFLSREKAILGDDANQFSTSNDHAAFVEEGDNDLLGGGGGDHEEITEFESSFPAIDSRNEVRCTLLPYNRPYQAQPRFCSRCQLSFQC